jgi:hypothetical protein
MEVLRGRLFGCKYHLGLLTPSPLPRPALIYPEALCWLLLEDPVNVLDMHYARLYLAGVGLQVERVRRLVRTREDVRRLRDVILILLHLLGSCWGVSRPHRNRLMNHTPD